MNNYVIAIDQSTSATKAVAFNERCEFVCRATVAHKQYYPQPGWVEHDPVEIYANTVLAVAQVVQKLTLLSEPPSNIEISITNQRETVVVWNRETGAPVYNAIVWQCLRGADICSELVRQGYMDTFRQKTGLIIDPYFSASGIRWILDNVEGVRKLAEDGTVIAGTIDSWLLWKLTEGKVHATDYTNASRSLLFNIHTLDWDDELLSLFDIPRQMMPHASPCDFVYGETTFDGLFLKPVSIAGMIGDSHGALVGQMCFEAGMGKATYGTGSSVMVNIGEKPLIASGGLVTSIGFAACKKIFYAYEGNIHCTGATIKWLQENLQIIDAPEQAETLAKSIPETNGVYFVPAFTGLGAPWWNMEAKAMIYGMTLGTGKAHIVRAGLEAIAYQVKDLIDKMTEQAGVSLKELRVDGGPTKNNFLMQFQSDILNSIVNISQIEEASALGAAIMNRLARKVWKGLDEIAELHKSQSVIKPEMDENNRNRLYSGWKENIKRIMNHKSQM